MNNTFTKQDLKAGMLVELERNKGKFLAMVYPYEDELCISCEQTWFPIRDIDDNLTNYSCKINKIYSVTNCPMNACKLLTEDRELLWERKEDDNKRKENIKKKNEMLEQREQLVKEIEDKVKQLKVLNVSYRQFMDANFKGDKEYYIPIDGYFRFTSVDIIDRFLHDLL